MSKKAAAVKAAEVSEMPEESLRPSWAGGHPGSKPSKIKAKGRNRRRRALALKSKRRNR